MSWKPKNYIIYSYKIIDELEKPDGWGYLCAGNLSEALCELLNVKSIGSEIKLIWNNQHKWQLIEDYKLEPIDLEDYIKADCSVLSFKTEFLMNRALQQLKKMGATSDIICVDNYRDVILNQAYFHRTGKFVFSINSTSE